MISQEQEKQQPFLLSWLNSWQVAPRFTWWTAQELQALSNDLQRASGVSWRPFYARLCCSSNGAARGFLGKKNVRDLGLRASEVEAYSASGRHR